MKLEPFFLQKIRAWFISLKNGKYITTQKKNGKYINPAKYVYNSFFKYVYNSNSMFF